MKLFSILQRLAALTAVKVISPLGVNAGDHYVKALNDEGTIVGQVAAPTRYRGYFCQPATSTSAAYEIPAPKGDSSAIFNAINYGGASAGYAQ